MNEERQTNHQHDMNANQDQQMPEEKVEAETSEQALVEEKKRSEEYLTRLKYAQADFENLKRRCDRQIEEVKKYSNERVVMGLLEVVDELELALRSGRSGDSSDAVIQGVEMTLKKLRKVLENEGVSPIDCLGKPFDPSKHNAIASIEEEGSTEEEGAKQCTVVEEVRKGYTMREKVIRPSIVKVVVKPSKTQKETSQNE